MSESDDTVVVDVPIISRTRTGGGGGVSAVHALHVGVWHRRMDPNTTACGLPFHSQFTPLRREELTHPLCAICFTAVECSKADANFRKQHEE